jgi:tripartite-type tricarboxylate transporter receptor subunit TctC
MKLPRRQFLHLAAGGAALPALSHFAWAQAYPTRPIAMIVPFPAGGATDTLARLLGERLRASLGQPVIIENVAGAAGSIGVGRAVRAAGDGYTLSIGTLTTHALIGGLYTLPFDLVMDFEPITQIASEPLLIVGKKSFPANSLGELIAYLRTHPDTVSVGIAGVGATGHLTGISFQRETGTRFQFVPYRGNGPATQDLVAGQIDFMIEPSSNFSGAGACRYYQGFRGDIKEPFYGGAHNSNRGRGRIARILLVALVWALGAQGHAEVCHRQAECGGRRCLG